MNAPRLIRTTLTLHILVSWLGVLAAFAAKPLWIEFPKPHFVSELAGFNLPNLEGPRREGVPMPVYTVPDGTVLVSQGKRVTSSDSAAVSLERLTDGDKSNADDTDIELAPGLQWVQIDVGEPISLAAVVFWHYHRPRLRVFLDVVVQVSNDPNFIHGVTTIYNSDHDNSSGLGAGTDATYIETNQGRAVLGHGTRARYVRCYSNGYVLGDRTTRKENQYLEVEIYGVPDS